MLAKVAPPTNDFTALARYLVHGKYGTAPDPKRVAWILTNNLPTDDPMLAAKLMQATAELSARTKNAAYHLMIAWEQCEQPTPEQMQTVARQALALAGLAEHEALIMGHGDKPHPHLHILLNRVHPTTGKAWKTSHDYARFDAIMKQLADQHGFRHVPTHRHNPEATAHLQKKPNSRATYAAKRGANTARVQWSREQSTAFGAELSEHFDRATSTDDIARHVADQGLQVVAKGNGFIVGNATGYAKLSSLRLTATARDGLLRSYRAKQSPILPAASIPTSPAGARSIFYVDAIDIVRAFVTLGLADKSQLRSAIDDAAAARAAKLANRPLLDQLMLELMASTAHTQPKAPRGAQQPAKRHASHRQGKGR